ncbi:unnamed protein product, partial [Polarella glacialis]
ACALLAMARAELGRGSLGAAQRDAAGAGSIFKALAEKSWQAAAARTLISATLATGPVCDAVAFLMLGHSSGQAALRQAIAKAHLSRGHGESSEEALRLAVDAVSLAQGTDEGAVEGRLPLSLGPSKEVLRGAADAVELLKGLPGHASAAQALARLQAQGGACE